MHITYWLLTAKVGFCVISGASTFSPVKNNLAEARKKSEAN